MTPDMKELRRLLVRTLEAIDCVNAKPATNYFDEHLKYIQQQIYDFTEKSMAEPEKAKPTRWDDIPVSKESVLSGDVTGNPFPVSRSADYRRAVEEAARLGAKVEFCVHGEHIWYTSKNPPNFDWESIDYRVAEPEKAKPREWWIDPKTSTAFGLPAYCTSGVLVHVREVLP